MLCTFLRGCAGSSVEANPRAQTGPGRGSSLLTQDLVSEPFSGSLTVDLNMLEVKQNMPYGVCTLPPSIEPSKRRFV